MKDRAITFLMVLLLTLGAVGAAQFYTSSVSRVESSSGDLSLRLAPANFTIRAGENVSLRASLYNVAPDENKVSAGANWSLPSVLGPCGPRLVGPYSPVAYQVLPGFYSYSNITSAPRISGSLGCPVAVTDIQAYDFEPNSEFAAIEGTCGLGQCPQGPMSWTVDASGYFGDKGVSSNFETGTYTVVAADEWGHVALSHFTALPTNGVKIDHVVVNWVGSIGGLEVYRGNVNLSTGATFAFGIPYNGLSVSYILESASASTPGFRVVGVIPLPPTDISASANSTITFTIQCPTESYSGDLVLLVTTSPP